MFLRGYALSPFEVEITAFRAGYFWKPKQEGTSWISETGGIDWLTEGTYQVDWIQSALPGDGSFSRDNLVHRMVGAANCFIAGAVLKRLSELSEENADLKMDSFELDAPLLDDPSAGPRIIELLCNAAGIAKSELLRPSPRNLAIRSRSRPWDRRAVPIELVPP
jgi:hypothetical protein